MKAAIFNPYLDTLGGGERYSLAVATALAKAGYEVEVQWPDASIKEKLEKRFGIILNGISFVPDIKRGDGYDVCFWVSDGSVPTLRSRKNFLHFQVPFHGVGGRTLLNRMKFFRIKEVICNSNFTKKFIDAEYGVQSVVIYPPVAVNKIKPKPKEDLIVYVGRFSKLAQAKRQEVLIKAFRKFFDSGFHSYKLIIAGGAEVGADKFLQELKEKSAGYPIHLIKSPDFDYLKDLYGKAKVFWSAAGFGVDELRHPEKVEHFGITSVEAMAAGAVPVIYDAGGYREIINKDAGFLWKKPEELISLTKKVVGETDLFAKISKNAIIESRKYSYEVFEKEFLKLI